jgi:hypothetical protein
VNAPTLQLDLRNGRRAAEAAAPINNPYAQGLTLSLAAWAPRGSGCVLTVRPASALDVPPGGSRTATLLAERSAGSSNGSRWDSRSAAGEAACGGSSPQPVVPGAVVECLVLVRDEARDTTEEAWRVLVVVG